MKHITATLLALLLSASASVADVAKVKDTVKWFEENVLCITLLSLATTNEYRLHLVYEVDDKFYTKEHTIRRFNLFFETVYSKAVDEDIFTEEENSYLNEKLGQMGFKQGSRLGVMVSAAGYEVLDKPYRDCVKQHDLDNGVNK